MRTGIVILSFLPFLYYATRDSFFHFYGRKVSLAEHLLHLVIGITLAVVLIQAVLGNSNIMLAALLIFAVTGSLDEYVWHRGLPEEESDLHAKEHLSLLIFVVVTLVVNWLESNQWQIPQEILDRIPGLSHSVESGSLLPAGAESPERSLLRTFVLPVFLLPYAYFGLSDNVHHFRHRKAPWAERILHLAIVLALFTVVPSAVMGNQSFMLLGLVLFLIARALDEWVFHRNLGGREADMHAKTHLAFLLFVVMSIAVDWATARYGI